MEYKEQALFSQEELELVSEGLERDLDMNPVTRVHYNTFVHEGLPILQTAHSEFNTKAWIEYTGHPFAALEVYDGDVLKYKIPSMVENLDTPVGDQDDRFCDHIQELLSLRADNPQLASRSVYNALTNIVGDNTEAIAKSAVETIIAVNKVFKDHGIAELSIGTFTEKEPETTTEEVVVQQSNMSDGFDEL